MLTPRRPPTNMAYHHGSLRQALIDAAVSLVREHGPDAVSVRKVARAAGVSSGAPFRHFSDKAALMAAVAEDGMDRLDAEIAAVLATAPDNPGEQFRAMGVASIRFAVRCPGHFRVMFRPEYATPKILERRQAQRDQMRSVVTAGQLDGTVREGDPEAIMLTAYAVVYGVSRMFVDRLFEAEGVSDDEVDMIADLVTAQLGAGLGGSSPS